MSKRPNDQWNRREFLTTAALAGTGALLELDPDSNRRRAAAGDEEDDRLVHGPSMCQAPQYITEDLLRSEGFADVRYNPKKDGVKGIEEALASGEADINLHFVAPLLLRVEAGDPL